MLSLLIRSTIFLVFAVAPSSAVDKVSLSAGVVQGARCINTPVTAFLSIPFAQPPVGDLRFASPLPLNETYPGGIYNATAPRAACLQFGTEFLESGPASEDCLYLNVWIPPNTTNTSFFPVKVWIYGGSETTGGISDPLYNGCYLAMDNTVVVSVAYRLGPLGFLALSSAGISGNFAIQDILMALQWIQSSIVAFGGDPRKVLLFGQSAGAMNTFVISTLPEAPSLMNAVIMESGGGRDTALNSSAQALGETYARAIGCDIYNITCFRSISVAELNSTYQRSGLQQLPATAIDRVNSNQFQPFVDGKVVPVQPSKAGVQVPAIFGSNTEDGTLFVLDQFETPAINATDYTNFLRDNFGSIADTIAKAYPLSAFNSTSFPAFYAIETIITDVSYKCPAYRGLKIANQKGIPAWTYLWNHASSCSWTTEIPDIALQILGPTHTSELPYIFGNLDNLPSPSGTCNSTSLERNISNTLISAWTSMAASRQPSNGNLQWPVYIPSQSLGIIIDNSTVPGLVDYTICEFWDEINAILPSATYPSALGRSNGAATGPNY